MIMAELKAEGSETVKSYVIFSLKELNCLNELELFSFKITCRISFTAVGIFVVEVHRVANQRTKWIYLCKTVIVNLYVVTPWDFTCGGFVLV